MKSPTGPEVMAFLYVVLSPIAALLVPLGFFMTLGASNLSKMWGANTSVSILAIGLVAFSLQVYSPIGLAFARWFVRLFVSEWAVIPDDVGWLKILRIFQNAAWIGLPLCFAIFALCFTILPKMTDFKIQMTLLILWLEFVYFNSTGFYPTFTELFTRTNESRFLRDVSAFSHLGIALWDEHRASALDCADRAARSAEDYLKYQLELEMESLSAARQRLNLMVKLKQTSHDSIRQFMIGLSRFPDLQGAGERITVFAHDTILGWIDEYKPIKRGPSRLTGLLKYVAGTIVVAIPIWQILPPDWQDTVSSQVIPPSVKATGVSLILSLSHSIHNLAVNLFTLASLVFLWLIIHTRADSFSPRIPKWTLSALQTYDSRESIQEKKQQ